MRVRVCVSGICMKSRGLSRKLRQKSYQECQSVTGKGERTLLDILSF